LLMVDDHVAGAELLRIIGARSDGDDARMVEAMADRRGAGRNAVDLDRHDLLAEQGDDAVQRAYPPHRARAPAHRFRPREIADDAFDRLRQNFARGPSGLIDLRE